MKKFLPSYRLLHVTVAIVVAVVLCYLVLVLVTKMFNSMFQIQQIGLALHG